MESLLSSEIARLVLGYLVEQNCEEAAQSFLEHSPHLSECRSVAQQGRKLSTRIMGHSLIDLLEEYCSVNSLVAERLNKLPEPAADLLQCSGLIQKLKFLIDATTSAQTVLVSITVPPQGTPSPGSNGTTGSSSGRIRSSLQSSSERIRRTSIRLQGQETNRKNEEKIVRIQPVEATSLRSLPGLSDSYLDSRSTQTSHDESCVERSKDSVEIRDDFQAVSSSSHCVHNNTKLFNFETNSGNMSHMISHDNCESVSVCTSTPKRKGFPCKRKSHSPITKLKKSSPSEVEQNESVDITIGTKGVPYKRKSHSPVTKLKKSSPSEVEQNESVDITILQQALLENKQLHEKIAENINRVMRIPGDGVVEPQIHLDTNLDIPPTTCDSMMQELNQAIKTIVDQTEQDPLFERFLDEIIGPVDEEASSSPAGGDSDADDARTSAAVSDDAPTFVPVADDSPPSAALADVTQTSAALADITHTSATVANDTPTSATVAGDIQTSATVADCTQTSGNVANDCRISVPTSSLQDSSAAELTVEIPLKQRLRSARNKLTESAMEQSGTSTPSCKEQRSKELALEDQNAAAIQSIINANLELTIERPRDKTTENSKKIIGKVAVECETVLENVSTPVSGNPTRSECVLEDCDLSKDNNFQIKNVDKSVQPLEHNANTVLPSSQQNIVLFDGNVTYTNQMPNSSFYWDTSKSQFSVPVVLTEQPAIMKPVHDMGNSQSIVITVPSLLPQEVLKTSDKQRNESENGQPPSTSSIIVCSEQNVSQPPPTSPELFGSSDFTTFGSRTLLPIAPKGSKIAVAEIPETGEKLVIRSLSKSEVLDFFSKDDVIRNYPSNGEVNKQQKSRKKKKSTCVRPSTAQEFQKLVNTLNVSNEAEISDNDICQSNLIEQTNISETECNEVVSESDSNKAVSESECNKAVSESEFTSGVGLNMPAISVNNEDNIKANNSGIIENKSLGKEQSDVLIALNLKQLEQTKTVDCPKTNSESHLFEKQISNNKVIVADSCLRETTKAIIHPSPRLNTGDTCKSSVVLESNNEKGSCNKDKRCTKSGEEENEVVKPRQTPLVQHLNDNNRRLSLSTPRKRASHIRALDFGTPVKSGTECRLSNSAPKESGRSQDISVPEMDNSSNDQRTKNVRSSLFKSPDIPTKRILPEELIGVKVNMCPIATRSPAPQLSGGWDKVTGAGLIFGDASPAYSFTSFDNNEITVNSNEDDLSKENTNSSNCASNTSPIKNKNQNKSVGKDAPSEDSDVVNNAGLSLGSVKHGTRAWDSDLRSIAYRDYNSSPEAKSALHKSDVVVDKNVNKKKKKSPLPKKKKEKKTPLNKAKKKPKTSKKMSTKLGKNSRLLETTSDETLNDLECSDRLSTSSETCLVTEEEVRLLESQLNSSSEKAEVCVSETDNSIGQVVNFSNNTEDCVKGGEISETVVQETDCYKSAAVIQPADCGKSAAVIQPADCGKSAADISTKDTKAGKIVSPKSKSVKAKAEFGEKQTKFNNKSPISQNENGSKEMDNNTPIQDINMVQPETNIEISKSIDISATTLVSNKVENVPISESLSCKSSFFSAREEEMLSISSSLQFMVTPRKLCPSQCPLTPRVLSPGLMETPISNFLREQQNMDFSMIPTPNFPPTPNIAVTPQSANSNSPTSYSSRLTDYSSCSSYYKPTNTPQKLLEQILIDECNRIEANINNKVMYLKNCKTISDCSVELVDFRKKSKSPPKRKENLVSTENVEISIAVQQSLKNDTEEKEGNQASAQCNMEAKSMEQVPSVSKQKFKTSSTSSSAVSNVFQSKSSDISNSENKIVKRQKKPSHTQNSEITIPPDDISLPLFKKNSARKVANNDIKINSNSLRNSKQRIGHAVKDKPFASILEAKKKRTLDTLKHSATKDRPKRRAVKENSDDKKSKCLATTSDKPDNGDTITFSVIKNMLPSKTSKEEHINESHSKITAEKIYLTDSMSGTNCDVSSSTNIVVERSNETPVIDTGGEAVTCDVTVEKAESGSQVTDDKSVNKSLKVFKNPPEKDSLSSPNKNKKLNMSVDMIASRLLLEAQKPSDNLNTSNEYLTITNEVGQENEVHSDDISVEDFPNLHVSTDDDTENETCVNKMTVVTDLKKVPSQVLKDNENELQTNVTRPQERFSKMSLVEENCVRSSSETVLQENNDNENNYTGQNLNKSDPEKDTIVEKIDALDHSIEETEPIIQIEERVDGNFIQIVYQGKGPSKVKPVEEDMEKLEYTLFYEDSGFIHLAVSNFFELLALDPMEKKRKKASSSKQNNEITDLVQMTKSCENVTKVSIQTNKKCNETLDVSQQMNNLDNTEQRLLEKDIKDQYYEKKPVKNIRESSNKRSGREYNQKSVKEDREKRAERNSKRIKAKSKSHIEDDYKTIDSACKTTTKGGKRPKDKKKYTSAENIATTIPFPAKDMSNDLIEKKIDAVLTCGTQSSDGHQNIPATGEDGLMTYALVGSHEEDLCDSISIDNSTFSRRKLGVKSEEMKTLPPKKRKASTDEIPVQPAEKRVCSDTQRNRDLLKLVNVDMFLDKVHSESKIVDSK